MSKKTIIVINIIAALSLGNVSFAANENAAPLATNNSSIFAKLQQFFRNFFIPGQQRKLETPAATTPKEQQDELCTLEFDPVCGTNKLTYANLCFAKKANALPVVEGECKIKAPLPIPKNLPTPSKQILKQPAAPEQKPAFSGTPVKVVPQTPASTANLTKEITLEADDLGFYPGSTVRVPKGANVKIHFIVRTKNTYPLGMQIRSNNNVFNTGPLSPGDTKEVEFKADQTFEFSSYWPSSGVLKANGKIVVE